MCLGYSFGGSIAQIVFLKLLLYYRDHMQQDSNLRCVTFGSPSFVNFAEIANLVQKSADLEKFLDKNLGIEKAFRFRSGVYLNYQNDEEKALFALVGEYYC